MSILILKKLRPYIILSIWSICFIFPQNIFAQADANKRIDSLLIGDRVELLGLDSLEKEIPGVEEILVNGKMMVVSFDSGRYVLPNQILVVNNIPVDTTKFQLRDIKTQMKYPITLKELLSWIGLGILIIALIILAVWMINNIRHNRTVLGKPIHVDPPHITALRTLEKIRQSNLWQNHKQKQFYTEITDALRLYIEGRYSISAMEKTSNELMFNLEKEDVSKEDFEELKELFACADLVKFAKFTASDAENEKAVPVAVRFVNSTFMQTLEDEIGKQNVSKGTESEVEETEEIEEIEETEENTSVVDKTGETSNNESKGSNFAEEMKKKLSIKDTEKEDNHE
ncbi:MAG: hypothetical protein WC140_00585 [Bacteroidales bacterium]